MNRSIEVQAWLADRPLMDEGAKTLAGEPAHLLEREDVFFACPPSRSKGIAHTPASSRAVYWQK